MVERPKYTTVHVHIRQLICTLGTKAISLLTMDKVLYRKCTLTGLRIGRSWRDALCEKAERSGMPCLHRAEVCQIKIMTPTNAMGFERRTLTTKCPKL